MPRMWSATALVFAIALTACTAADTPASVSEEVDRLLRKDISLAPEDRTQIERLRAQSERLRREGKERESLDALKQVRAILKKAQDADLLRKSEG